MSTTAHPSRKGWFIPHETTIALPDGREIVVDGIPYEGWGTTPGRYGYLIDYVELANGGFDFSRSVTWLITSPDSRPHPASGPTLLNAAN